MREVIEGSLYRHFKGNWYKVLAVAEHTETGEKLVIYSPIKDMTKVYARPYSMFVESIPTSAPNNTAGQKYRFVALSEISDDLYGGTENYIQSDKCKSVFSEGVAALAYFKSSWNWR